MHEYVRITKLSDIVGRADYISDPARQEDIVAASVPIDWTPYHEFERLNQKTSVPNNEGREVVVALPNEWADLPTEELHCRAEEMAVLAADKTTVQWAVHWNQAHTNLHLHVIFSERERCRSGAIERWDRDVYLTADGKVARRKADRAKASDGSVKPPLHRKGDLKGGFSVKDTRYKAIGWRTQLVRRVTSALQRFGAVIEPAELVSQYHEGKGSEAPLIRHKNEIIKVNNQLWELYRKKYPGISQSRLPDLIREASYHRCKILHLVPLGGKRFRSEYLTLDDWRALQDAPAAGAKTSVLGKLERYRQQQSPHPRHHRDDGAR